MTVPLTAKFIYHRRGPEKYEKHCQDSLSVVQYEFDEATRILFVRKENKKKFSTIRLLSVSPSQLSVFTL